MNGKAWWFQENLEARTLHENEEASSSTYDLALVRLAKMNIIRIELEEGTQKGVQMKDEQFSNERGRRSRDRSN